MFLDWIQFLFLTDFREAYFSNALLSAIEIQINNKEIK